MPSQRVGKRPMRLRTALVSVACGLLFLTPACAPQSRSPTGTGTPASTGQHSRQSQTRDLRAAIDRAAGYLARACDDNGQFIYRIHLDPTTHVEPRYNILRHAGAIYALAQYCDRYPDAEVRRAILRAASFLREKSIAPVAGNTRMLAAWTRPEIVLNDKPRQAKLGGTGLALIALLRVEEIQPGFTPLEQLRGLGRFLIFMQKSDGRFYSKFFPESGRSDAWQSMYYPGEAALGLLMLYQHDPAQQWLHTAVKAMDAIARQGADRQPTLPDQWFLLAAERLLPLMDESNAVVRQNVMRHARRTCRDMLADQKGQMADTTLHGCYTSDGRSCPSATRLEGLLAALAFLPADETTRKQEIRASIDAGIQFLLRCQVVDGSQQGALPRVIQGFQPTSADPAEKRRAGEVRIDYVQHALSALLRYAELAGD